MAKFKKDDKVIVVHDVENLTTGDVCVVEAPEMGCCGGVKVDKSNQHINPDNLEIYRGELPSEYKIGVDKDEILKGINRLMQMGTIASVQGIIPIDNFRKELTIFIARLNLAEAFNEKYA